MYENQNDPAESETEIELGEQIFSIMGKKTFRTLETKEKLQYALSDALDASMTMGHELGIMDEHERILRLLSDSGTEFGREAAEFLIRNPRAEE